MAGRVADADNKCGNGTSWRIELLAKTGRRSLAEGSFENGSEQQISADLVIDVRSGDVISLIVNSSNNDHVCDTTHVELTLSEVGAEARRWDMATDVVDHIHEMNPLPDAYGNEDTWHFCARDVATNRKTPLVAGSTLTGWRDAVANSQSAETIAGDFAARRSIKCAGRKC